MKSRNSQAGVVVLSTFVLCAFTFWMLPGALPTEGRAKDEEIIRRLNEEVLHAHDVADAATLDRIEDADFTLSGDFGLVSKKGQLNEVRNRTRKPEVITRKIDPQVFRFYEGVALVTETDRSTTKDGTFAYQSTEVWVHRGDSWRLVHLHYSRLEEKQ